MIQSSTRPPVLVTWVVCIALVVSAGSAAAQSSSTPALSTVAPAPSAKTSGGSSGGSSTKPHRYRTVVSLYWENTPPLVFPRRTVTPQVAYVPRARATAPTVMVNPTIPFQTKQSGLSTAMPGWKVASSVLQTSSSPTTGHTTYSPPAVVNTYDVIVPRRRFSYGISFVKTY